MSVVAGGDLVAARSGLLLEAAAIGGGVNGMSTALQLKLSKYSREVRAFRDLRIQLLSTGRDSQRVARRGKLSKERRRKPPAIDK
jgi:hypothetical protein